MPTNQGQSESPPTGAYLNSSNCEMNSLWATITLTN
jgi:hypothetical protein